MGGINRIYILQRIFHEITKNIIANLTAPLGGLRKIDHTVMVAQVHQAAAAKMGGAGGSIDSGARRNIHGQKTCQYDDRYFM